VGNTANSTTEGNWQYSTDGTNWFDIGAVADGANALALSASTKVRFVPASNYNGTPVALSVRALDNTYSSFSSGNTKVTIDTTNRGGVTAIAANPNTITTSITAVNDAPSFTNNATLTAIAEDTTNPVGNIISSLFAGLFDDPDTGASLSGIAVVGNTPNSTTEGNWQYSTDSTNWFDIGSVDDGANALALSASTKVRFVPVSNYNGTPAPLSVRALDNTYSSFSSGNTKVTIDTTARGGVTAIAANLNTITTSLTAVNDAPSFTNNATLAAIPGNTANPPGNLISSLFASLFSDPDTGASLSGVAVVGNSANPTTEGAWQYSTDGTNWFAIGTVEDGANALALSSATKVRFVPVANYNGTPPNLNIRALDDTYSSFTNGSNRLNINVTTRGGITAIAANLNTIATNITVPVNQNPIVNLLAGSSPNVLYTENDAPVLISNATVKDDDSANFDTGTLTVRFSSGGSPDDRLNIRNQGTGANQINLDGRIIKYGSAQIGTFSGGIGTENLVISLNANATSIAVQALLGNITYANVSHSPISQNPSTINRTVEIVLTDGDGGTSTPVSKNIALTSQNDAPLVGEAKVLYDGSTKVSPADFGIGFTPWFTFQDATLLLGGKASELPGSSSGITLTTDNKAYAGYVNYGINFGTALLGGGKIQFTPTPVNPSFPTLDRNLGYTLSFVAELESETARLEGSDVNQDSKDDRAGFNVTLLSDDKKGIQLGFWGDRIWAYEDSTTQINPSDEPDNPLPRNNFRTLFTQAEGVNFNTKSLINYDLTIFGDTYTLFANNNVILNGRLRDYSAFKPPSYPIATPELPNIPGLDIPGLDIPGLDIPGLDIPGLDIPGLDIPGLNIPGLSDILELLDTSLLPNLLEILNIPEVQTIIQTISVGIPGIPEISELITIPGLSDILQLLDITEIPDVLKILETPGFPGNIIQLIDIPETQKIIELLDTPGFKDILQFLDTLEIKDIIGLPDISEPQITLPNPYEKGNLIFLGDNSVQAGATVKLSGIGLTTAKNFTSQIINEDQSTNPIRFFIQDFETAAGNLTITPTSDNTTLIPNANIVVEGTGSVRTVTVTPAANQNGNAKISLNVGDGTNTTTRTFDVNVVPINDAPSFTKGADQIITAGAGQQTVTGWASGFNPGANELQQIVDSYIINIIRNADVFATAPIIDSITGNLIYTPANTINTSTTATVEVFVKDNGGDDFGGVDTSITPQIFTITVNPQIISIEATDATAAESGNDTGTFRISREFTKGNLTVNLAADNSSTASNSDYSLSSGGLSVIIPDGKSFVDVSLTAVDDNFAEPREALQLNLLTGTGYTINPAKNNGTISIIDNDTITIEFNIINGTDSLETLGGTVGNDRIFAFGGNDTVVAGLGIDEIFGGDGNDRLFGGEGDDRIFGETGNDQMWGDAGEDFIYGGVGNDVCTGGFGRDTFVVTRGEGVDTITDFRIGEDSIACGGGLRFDSLLITQSGNNTLIADNSNNRNLAILVGVNASSLTANYFRTV
jgi:RTX calcium-binding nonapeptide repeat (4 copies)